MMFDLRLQRPRIFYHQPAVATCVQGVTFAGIPFVNNGESRRWLASDQLVVDGIEMTAHATDSVALDATADTEDPYHPFAAVQGELRRSDLAFGNLECPLSNRGRPTRNDQCFSASPSFAEALAAAPFHVVSFANNHCMDYGEVAFRDTVDALHAQGIAVVGAGGSLEEARRPVRVKVNGTSIAFLGYTMIGPDAVFACDRECGAVPLNPIMIEQDIDAVRSHVDLIIVSAHWGGELMTKPAPWLVGFAHRIIDSGADVLLGHHAHIPAAIEIYKNRLICYSLGNFCFGHGHSYWADNMLTRLLIADGQLCTVELTAITGTYQPRLVDGVGAAAFHQNLVQLSEPFGTVIDFRDGRSHLELVSGER